MQSNGPFFDSPLRDASVVHSSYGRLRVHLPHWSGTRDDTIATGLHRLAGVTHAEANSLTGNALILFDPERTTASAVLDELPGLRLDDPPILLAVCGDAVQPEPAQPETADYVQGTRAVVYRVLGWTSVGMAVVGAITPGIPTAPFVILAGYFFIRSSPASHQWLRRSRWFGPILRDWEVHRGIRRSLRNAALALIGGSMVVTAFIGLPAPLTVSIVAMQVIGLTIVLRLKVVEPVPPTAAENRLLPA
jgi:uncharacterized membrane protein YbaN (DUF454 family)